MGEAQVVIVDSRLPTDRLLFEDIDTETDGPKFTISEVAKLFFARSPHWVRWQERKGNLTLDGNIVGQHRSDAGSRFYTLADVEQMAHALATRKAIGGDQLNNAMLIAQSVARLYHLL